MTSTRTPAQLYALIVGAALLGAGILGFFYNSSFAVGDDVPRDAVLGLLDVNAWHNIVHLATGALGLMTFVPSLYLYPSQPGSLNRFSNILGAVWTILLLAIFWRGSVGEDHLYSAARTGCQGALLALLIISVTWPALRILSITPVIGLFVAMCSVSAQSDRSTPARHPPDPGLANPDQLLGSPAGRRAVRL